MNPLELMNHRLFLELYVVNVAQKEKDYPLPPRLGLTGN